MSTEGAASSQAASTAASAASALIAHLPPEHKYALGGLCAGLLGRAHRQRLWSDPWCRQHLQRIARRFLQLDVDQCEGLVPLLEASGHVEPAAFVSLLPPGEHERAALLLGLLVLTVASEDAQLGGYDARARQLLADVALELGVQTTVVSSRASRRPASPVQLFIGGRGC